MVRFYQILLFFLFIGHASLASVNPFPIGARSWALGNALVAEPQAQSFFYNPAGIGYHTHSLAYAAYHSRFAAVGLANMAVGGTLHTKLLTIGIGGEQFGDKLYHESKVGIAIAKNTGIASIGLKISYLNVGIENLTSRGGLLTELGVMARLHPKLMLGFHAHNLTGVQLFANEKLPMVLRFGMAFRPAKQVLFLAEVEKNTFYPYRVKAGLEYEFYKQWYVRTGVNSDVRTLHGGLGVQQSVFLIDYGVSSSQYLGLQHHFTITYNFSKEKPLSAK